MGIAKIGILVAVAAAMGALGGGYYVHTRLAADLTVVMATRDEAVAAQAKTREELEALTRETKRLKVENDGLRGQVEGLRQAAAAQPPAMEQPVPAERTSLDTLLATADSTATDAPKPASPTVVPSQTPGGVTRPSNDSRPQNAELMEQIRARTQEAVQGEAEKTADPVVRRRLESLGQYADELIDLIQQIHDATDEPQRTALQQRFDETRQTVTNLVQEQQDYVLRQVAARHGIADPAKQQALVNAIREAESSPFFRTPMLMWGGTGNPTRR